MIEAAKIPLLRHAMTLSLRHLFSAVLVATLMSCLPGVHAQTYPVKPIRLVVPLAPGGGNDLLGRYISKLLSESLGQPIVVENRAGGDGNIGVEYVARSAPDGYTLLMGGAGQLAVPARGVRKYDPVRDFAPLSMIGEFSSLLAVHPSVPARNVAELVRFAKARPGQINYASSGTGSTGHLVMEMFRLAVGINIVQIPYTGAGQALTDVMAGQVSMIFSNPLGSMPYLKSGRLRAIAVSSAQRVSALPELPTVAESGYPGFEATIWLSMLAPAGTPRDVVARLNSELVKIVQRPDVREWLNQQGLQPIGNTPEQFSNRLKTDIEKWDRVIREAGIKIES